MSNRRQPRDPDRRTTTPVTRVKDPADVVTIVPYLLGFDPEESLVLVALEGPRQRFGPCARLDLVDERDHEGAVQHQVGYVCDLIAHHGFDPVVLVAYSTRVEVADAVVTGLLAALASQGVTVVEALRADGSRWWSYVCDDAVCCPPGGTAYDAESSRVAAEAVLAGLARAPSRDALREQFEPHPLQRAAFDESFRAMLRGADLGSWTESGFRQAVVDSVAASEPMAMDHLVRLVLTVQSTPMRDLAWSLITRDNAADHFAFWSGALRAVPDDLLAPVGSLAAFAAWLSGCGVLASHGAERVLHVHPEYSMARLLLELCASSVNPGVWTFGEQGNRPERTA